MRPRAISVMTNKIDALTCRRSNYNNTDDNNLNYNKYTISRSAIGLSLRLESPEKIRRQYPRRLKVFLDYMKLEGPIEQQAVPLLTLIKQNSHRGYNPASCSLYPSKRNEQAIMKYRIQRLATTTRRNKTIHRNEYRYTCHKLEERYQEVFRQEKGLNK